MGDYREQAESVRKARGVQDPRASLVTVEWQDFKPGYFQDNVARRFLLPFDTELLWYPHWLSWEEANELEKTVRENVTFLHPTYMFQEPGGGFTRTLIKRGQMRICDIDECPGAVAAAPLEPWSRSLLCAVGDAADTALNCFVANHYSNGRVVINWHSDSGPGDDEGLGPNPHIGSISLGADRTFALKSKRPLGGKMVHLDIPLTHGSLLVMGHNSQTHWLHALLPDENCKHDRINLTFRFYARESTKHIEGMEHNHEWEAAPGSTRVKLHRGRFGRPVLVDIPDDLITEQLTRYLSSVLHGFRGRTQISIKDRRGQWVPVADGASVVNAIKQTSSGDSVPDLQVIPGGDSTRRNAGGHAQASSAAGWWNNASTPPAAAKGRWARAQGYNKGKGRGY